jgi:uncharacterized membrane protein YdbT with pleckstrin-like domain
MTGVGRRRIQARIWVAIIGVLLMLLVLWGISWNRRRYSSGEVRGPAVGNLSPPEVPAPRP